MVFAEFQILFFADRKSCVEDVFSCQLLDFHFFVKLSYPFLDVVGYSAITSSSNSLLLFFCHLFSSIIYFHAFSYIAFIIF